MTTLAAAQLAAMLRLKAQPTMGEVAFDWAFTPSTPPRAQIAPARLDYFMR